MPPRKRTSQSKRTPPTSPTTPTFHVPANQHHHLRHTGPSVTTRSGVSAAQSAPSSESSPTQQGPREQKLPAEVSPPNIRTPFTKFVYALLLLALLLLVWHVYGMVMLLERLTDEVGWWSIVVGDRARTMRWETLKGWGFDGSGGETVNGEGLESPLNALADALGISPVLVASAVKPLIPQASLTSLASKTGATGGPEAIRILFEDTTAGMRASRDEAGTPGIAEEFSERLGKGAGEERVAEGGEV